MTKEEAIAILSHDKGQIDYPHGAYGIALEMAIKALQEEKVGHWIYTNDYYTGAYGCIDYVECSCCHEESLEEGDYCPNCGCRMNEVSK